MYAAMSVRSDKRLIDRVQDQRNGLRLTEIRSDGADQLAYCPTGIAREHRLSVCRALVPSFALTSGILPEGPGSGTDW
jgi:hypothetical protein